MFKQRLQREEVLGNVVISKNFLRTCKDHDGDLHQQPCYRQHQLSPPLCSGVTSLFFIAILYLNVVLNTIYYYPMICGYPMMFE